MKDQLDRIAESLEALRQELRNLRGLRSGRRRLWSDLERQTLREMYPDTPSWLIALVLNRSEKAIYSQAKSMGLRKKPDWHTDPLSGCNRPGFAIHGHDSRFGKGHRPANKGVKGWQAGGRSVATQFKPGQMPKTWVPVGTISKDKDGYLKKKVSDHRDRASRFNWKFCHVLEWEKHHGPVPEGHNVVFRNGDKSDIRIDNLELITNAELMRRNTLHRYPKPIAQAIQLRGVLTRKINTRRKEL